MDQTGVGTVCVWIWAVTCVVHGQNYVNVARGKTYSQSSAYPDQGPSSRAANGDTGGDFFSANCIHTAQDGDLNPWWEVDLGQPYPVYNIDLWARTNFEARLYPSDVTVDGQTCAAITNATSPRTRKKTVTCPVIMKGRTVRVTRHAISREIVPNRTLNMCEVEIWVCTDGWYSQQCSTHCSPGCQNTACDRQSAQCSPCNAGYTGTRCAECADKYYKINSGTCTSCSSSCLNQLCDKISGTCNGCVTGRHGPQCSSPCAAGCLACDQQSGKCSSCKDGWYGYQCSIRCLPGCLNNTCDRQSGKCSSCKDGQYGDHCTVPCPPGCLNNTCDHQSGKCTSCKDGQYGYHCTVPCPPGCLNNTCDHQSGKCSSCKGGQYGYHCTVPCPPGCLNNTCDHQSGKCSSCKGGRYGDFCSVPCPPGCLNTCDQQSGRCTSCKTGYEGSNCLERDNTNAIIGSVIGGALFIGIIVIVLGIIILRRGFVRFKGTRQNSQAFKDINLPSTSRRPGAAAGDEVQGQEQPYEIAEFRPIATIATGDTVGPRTPPASSLSDVHRQRSETDSASNPYDQPAVQYCNTEDVRIYDRWLGSSPPQKDAHKPSVLATVHRAGKEKKGARPILVKFISRRKRQEVMEKKKLLREKEEYKGVYINDDLTPPRAKLLGFVQRQENIQRAWTVNGKIQYVKKVPVGMSTQQKPFIIESPKDLFKLGIEPMATDFANLGLSHLVMADEDE
ncbi:hypothetical protein ACOMHN_021559 [Nucella lapillus]